MYNNEKLYKIVVLDDQGTGKTSLMNQYINEKFTIAYQTTKGVDFLEKGVIIADRKVRLQMWDIGDQECFTSLGKPFYRGADCCVLVYDITNPKSFESLQLWKQDFLIQGQPRHPEKFPFVVIGNKLDKANERQISYEIAQSWCKQNGITQYFEVSAQDSTNLEQAFQDIAVIADELG